MTWQKRLFDLCVGIVLLALLFPVLFLTAFFVLLIDGRPVLYGSERMKTVSEPFILWKFRTMRVAADDCGVSGGDKTGRITKLGHILRRYRLDELPQLWNVISGDISLVGPRAPLEQYVDRFPVLYAKVLESRPGITGLATLVFHRREGELLASTKTADETDDVYCRRCIPVKARLDMIYSQNQSICFDAVILWRTVIKVLH